MTTLLAQHPVPGGRGALRRAGQLRHTSPGRLQLLLVLLLVLGALTGLVAGLTATSAAAGTADLRDRAQPLLAEAETIYSSLAEADTIAAQAFLAGGLEPAALTARYEERLAQVTTALTSASRRTPEGSEAAEAVHALAAGTTRYAALVATARAANRQGLPVGASYLSTASELNQQTLQPTAQSLFQFASREVDAGYEVARSSWWLILLLVLVVALTSALVATQVYLSRATRRTFNLPLVAATGLTVLLVAATGVLFALQRDHLRSAGEDGSVPVTALAERRILALRERASEALTLAARAGDGPHEEDFTAAQARLTFDDPELLKEAGLMRQARAQHDAYLALHQQVRELDDNGDYDGAVKLAVGQDSTDAFAALTGTLDEALDRRRAVFDEEIHQAGRGLGALTILAPLLVLAACVLAALGLRARLEEYR
ncbi:hypothetical protein FB565_003705 [Actinoplanes lutulentus]|uniref:Secreted protein n=1 Tax=Actinoplanes lutulentus TaxID=1287878 RepID=A0A327ZKL2_9ACTN|nr:hypothetical protein [Actinoplanes lutulentus]MBB2943976.1 hypothetical protein [Actinoplanes lutulentus]RAK42791.1 hypothetical protein B0I29_102617 [Actinoplanes lutulentus]